MPFINGVKFACNSCIKGHRSSHCTHVERPLIEIRRKGRPVTQCAYCRHLRKTKQVHVKCLCSKSKQQRSKHTSPSTTTTTVEDNVNNFQHHFKEEEGSAAAAAAAAAVAAVTAYAQQQPSLLTATTTTTTTTTTVTNPFALDEVVLSPWSAYMPQPPTPPPQDEQYCWLPSSSPFQWDCGTSVASMSLPLAPSSQPLALQSPPSDSTSTTVAAGTTMTTLPQHQVLEPEAFVITITPLTPEDKPTITRVVTCNCDRTCVSPGCLVHSLTTTQQSTVAAAAAAASSTILLLPPPPFVGVPC